MILKVHISYQQNVIGFPLTIVVTDFNKKLNKLYNR